MSSETTNPSSPDSNNTDNQARSRRGGHMQKQKRINYKSGFSRAMLAIFHHVMSRTCGEEVAPGEEDEYRSADIHASAQNATITVAMFILMIMQLGHFKERVNRVHKFMEQAIPFLERARNFNMKRLTDGERLPAWLKKDMEADNAFISHLLTNWPVLMSIATSLQGAVPAISTTIDQAGKSVMLETPEQAVKRMLYHFAEAARGLSPTVQSLAGSLSLFVPAVNAGLLTREDISAFVGFATRELTPTQFKQHLLMAPSSVKALPAPKKAKRGDRVPVTEPAPGQAVEPRSPVGSLSPDDTAVLARVIEAGGNSTAVEPAAAPVVEETHEVDNMEEGVSTPESTTPKPLTLEEMKAKAAAIRAASGNAPKANGGESAKEKPKERGSRRKNAKSEAEA